MADAVPRDVLRKIRKLIQLPQEVRQSQFAVSITRLTVMKSLCQKPEVANRFAIHLAYKTLERVEQKKGRSSRPKGATDLAHREMMSAALGGMKAWQQKATEDLRRKLRNLLDQMQAVQNEHRRISWGLVRVITDSELLLFEYALRCMLSPSEEAGQFAYQVARHYAERHDSAHGPGLVPASAPLLQDIANFWMREVDLDSASIRSSRRKQESPAMKVSSPKEERNSIGRPKRVSFTHRQGQFLAFIQMYRRLHHQGPAELDLVRFFRITPPSAHSMIVRLEQLGLVIREQGVPRSVRVSIPESEIPALEESEGPPW